MKPLRVACYGDSLTSGLVTWGQPYCPYGDIVTKLSQGQFTCVTFDFPGKGSTYILNCLKTAGHEKGSFDLYCVLCGSNDIGHGESSSDIILSIQEMCEFVADMNAIPVLITIPAISHQEITPSTSQSMQRAIVCRERVNSQLPVLAESFNGFVVDVFTATSSPALETDSFRIAQLADSDEEASGEEVDTADVRWMRQELSIDGLHFNELGYQLMGQVVFSEMDAWQKDRDRSAHH